MATFIRLSLFSQPYNGSHSVQDCLSSLLLLKHPPELLYLVKHFGLLANLEMLKSASSGQVLGAFSWQAGL